MTQTKKYQDFLSEPMRTKDVKHIPGIGKKIGEKLIEADYTKAYNVLGVFLGVDQSYDTFTDFMNRYGANRTQANSTYDALKHWCDKFI